MALRKFLNFWVPKVAFCSHVLSQEKGFYPPQVARAALSVAPNAYSAPTAGAGDQNSRTCATSPTNFTLTPVNATCRLRDWQNWTLVE